MEPKERLETMASTKIAYVKKRLGGEDGPLEFSVEPGDAETILEEWPATPKKVGRKLIEQYGPHNEVTPTRIIWHNNGPWKRTILTGMRCLTSFRRLTLTSSATTSTTEFLQRKQPISRSSTEA